MMRKTHEKAGICTIALVPEFHQCKSGARLCHNALHVGNRVTIQALICGPVSHFEAGTRQVVEFRQK